MDEKRIVDYEFFLAKEDKAAAKATLVGNMYLPDVEEKTFHDLFKVFCLEFEYEFGEDETGDIIGANYYSKWGLDALFSMFRAIAPFVREGSYIQMLNMCTGDMWRWVFEGGTCREIEPQIIWGQEKA